MSATKRSGSEAVLRTLRSLPPRHFEQFLADVWQERQGWTTEVSPPGPDGGIDVLGRPPGGGPATALQAKRYDEGNKVVSATIQQSAALRLQEAAVDGVTVVTTSSFTQTAKERAEQLDVRLIDGGMLTELIERYDAYDILEWYAAGKPERWNP